MELRGKALAGSWKQTCCSSAERTTAATAPVSEWKPGMPHSGGQEAPAQPLKVHSAVSTCIRSVRAHRSASAASING
jgi:hypothetical protein